MIRSLACALLLAACGGGAKSAPVGNDSPKGAPTGPAPQLTFVAEEFAFGAVGLPAIAADGSVVVGHAIVGEGGPPGIIVVVRDRTDAIVHEEPGVQDVADPADVDLGPTNVYLTKLHGERDLRPLAAATVKSEGEGRFDSVAWEGGLGGVAFTFAQETGRFTLVGGGASIDQVMTDWLVAPYPMCPDCEELCSNPPVVEAAWIDEGRKAAVLLIGYLGDDTCWEPASQPHVVTW